jgi:serine protease Do
MPREFDSYRDLVKKVLPAVVSIDSRIKQPARANKDKDKPGIRRRFNFEGAVPPGAPEELRRFLEQPQMEEPEVPDLPHGGFGSGFLVDGNGIVVTNNHVVDGAEQVEVQLQDGRKFLSKEIHRDPKTDLAIVKIDAKGLPFLEMGDSDQMEIGDRVLAIGAPFGLTGSVTHGIISAKGRNGLSMNMYEDFLQTDAPINPGNSGGPLVSLDGKVVGVDAAIKTQSGGFQGVGLAIASNLVKTITPQLLKDGVVHRGYLGVQIKDLTDQEVAERLGAKEGVLVGQVFDKSPAAKAGVQAGDVITTLNGKVVKDGRVLQRIVATLPLGKPADLNVVRDGKPLELKVTVEEQPEEFGSARAPVQRPQGREAASVSLDKLGVDVADLTPELADQYGFRDGAQGVVVTRVERNGLAEEAGLRKGVLIVKIDKEPVASAAALKEHVERSALDKGLLLQVQTPRGGAGFVILKAPATK